MRPLVVTLAIVGLASCDIPTEAPRWEQMWVVPGESVAISVADLVPADVFLSEDRSAFRVTTVPVRESETLGGMCSACTPLNGLVAPKPAFTGTLRSTAALPVDVVSALLTGGELDAVLEHNMGFDPLRPSADASERGHVVVEVTSNGAVVAIDSISGHDRAFPPGTPLVPSLPVQAVSVTNALEVEVRIWSPSGDPALVTTSDTLGFTMAASVVNVSAVTVQATALAIRPTATPLDFGIDDDLLDRIERGAVRIGVVNPFDVIGTLNLRFAVGAEEVDRSLALQPGEFTERLEYSGDEMRAILGSPGLDLITSGTVGAASGTLTITPAQEMAVDIRFELGIRVGGQGGS